MRKQRMGVWVAGATMAATVALAGCSSTSTTSTGSPGATSAPATSVSGTSPTTEGTTPRGTAPKGTTPGTAAPGGEGTTEFCASIKAADDRSKTTTGAAQSKPSRKEIDAFIDDLRSARDAGPAEMQEPLTTIIDAYTAFAAVAEDPNPDEKALELFLSEKSLDAEQKLEQFVKSECGFTINTGSSEQGPTDTPGGTFPTSTDDSPTSIENVKKAIKAKAGNLSWAPAINNGSWGYSGDGTTYTWTVMADSSGRALTADSAFDACTLIVEHLAPLQPSLALQIQSSDGTTLAEKTVTATDCKKV